MEMKLWRTAVLVLLAVAGLSADTPGDPRKPGLQLYSVRREMAKDRAAALATVKSMGITEVEGGVMGRPVGEVKAELAAAGLTMTSGGAGYEDLRDKLPEVIANAKAIGVKYLMCAWIPHDKSGFTAADVTRAAADFNAWGAKLAAEGITFAYHPHGYEFAPGSKPGTTLFDDLVAATDPNAVSFEMDVFWAFHGGADPTALLKKYPKRFVMLHLKDMRKGTPTGIFTGSAPDDTNVPLGTGQIDWVSLLAEAKKQGVAHYFIEDESEQAVQQIPLSLKYLASLQP
jgi:sugar phosphate isomerase/epimerase